MASIAQLASLSGDALRQILTPIGAGFSLECISYGDAEAIQVGLMLPSVEVSGVIPEGADDGTLSGFFSLADPVKAVSLIEIASLCAKLQEAGLPWDVDAESRRPYVCLKTERQRGDRGDGYVFSFWISLLHEVMLAAPCFRALNMGQSPEFAADLASPS
jgi:hypothetical protein